MRLSYFLLWLFAIGVRFYMERLANLCFNLLGNLVVLAQENAGVLSSLSQAYVTI